MSEVCNSVVSEWVAGHGEACPANADVGGVSALPLIATAVMCGITDRKVAWCHESVS